MWYSSHNLKQEKRKKPTQCYITTIKYDIKYNTDTDISKEIPQVIFNNKNKNSSSVTKLKNQVFYYVFLLNQLQQN